MVVLFTGKCCSRRQVDGEHNDSFSIGPQKDFAVRLHVVEVEKELVGFPGRAVHSLCTACRCAGFQAIPQGGIRLVFPRTKKVVLISYACIAGPLDDPIRGIFRLQNRTYSLAPFLRNLDLSHVQQPPDSLAVRHHGIN